jgi:hypothetical protein
LDAIERQTDKRKLDLVLRQERFKSLQSRKMAAGVEADRHLLTGEIFWPSNL